ncbi:PIGU [Symbiodinium pilosum]|uniref:PIGU protein n=1 Tax=Symbiodinium pilosum TaxID=2952 RepID=A0A812LY03_SYMPI|nr:PIGU [Symbiodinium pilosum]
MLEEHLEVNSPITSHIRLKEGLFFLNNGISPYAGDTCHHPPLLLFLLQQLEQISPWAHFGFLVSIDVVTALLLRQLAVCYHLARRQAGSPWADASSPLVASTKLPAIQVAEGIEDVMSPAFVGLFYLLNPLTVASCVALSVQNLQHLFFVFSIVAAAAGRGGLSAAGIAVSLYVCPLTPALLVLPCACLAYQQRFARAKEECTKYDALVKGQIVNIGFVIYSVCFSLVVLGAFGCLLGASLAAMAGELQFLEAAFLSVLSIRDLTPNTGFFWYFFIEVFQRYYFLFVFAFHAHILFYPVPLHLRLGGYAPTGPFIHCSAAVGMIALFKPYPTASDYALMVSAMLVQAELIRESQRYFAFLLSGVMFGLSMVPTMVAVWLGRNAGNANYLYNMTLVVNVFGSLTLSEWVKAGMRLRKRQFRLAYFRKMVLSLANEVAADPAAAKVKASLPAPDADTAVT